MVCAVEAWPKEATIMFLNTHSGYPGHFNFLSNHVDKVKSNTHHDAEGSPHPRLNTTRLVTMVEAIKPTIERVCNADTQTPIRTEDNWLLRLKGCLRNVRSLRNFDEWAVRHIVMMNERWRGLLCSSMASLTSLYTAFLRIAGSLIPTDKT